jgi:hypothetical protein
LVSQAKGSIFRRTDGKYFIYLPKALVEDTGFPFPIHEMPKKIMIRFKRGDKKLIIEKDRKN